MGIFKNLFAQGSNNPAEAEVRAEKREAPGSAGDIKIHDVPDATAAMIMAIVAEQLGTPLNQLRFKSIKEIKNR